MRFNVTQLRNCSNLISKALWSFFYFNLINNHIVGQNVISLEFKFSQMIFTYSYSFFSLSSASIPAQIRQDEGKSCPSSSESLKHFYQQSKYWGQLSTIVGWNLDYHPMTVAQDFDMDIYTWWIAYPQVNESWSPLEVEKDGGWDSLGSKFYQTSNQYNTLSCLTSMLYVIKSPTYGTKPANNNQL